MMYLVGREIRYEQHSSEYTHSVFLRLSNTLFLNSKTRGDSKKWTSDSESASKNTQIKQLKKGY